MNLFSNKLEIEFKLEPQIFPKKLSTFQNRTTCLKRTEFLVVFRIKRTSKQVTTQLNCCLS